MNSNLLFKLLCFHSFYDKQVINRSYEDDLHQIFLKIYINPFLCFFLDFFRSKIRYFMKPLILLSV